MVRSQDHSCVKKGQERSPRWGATPTGHISERLTGRGPHVILPFVCVRKGL